MPSKSDRYAETRASTSLSLAPAREAILRVLEKCPDDMLELLATLLQEHVWRKRDGLA